MPAIGFSHYNLRAPRALLDELREFYCDVVGLELGARPPFRSFGYWLYAGGHPVLHLSEAGRRLGRIASDMTHTEAAGARLMRLPLWADMPDNDVAFVIDRVTDCVERACG